MSYTADPWYVSKRLAAAVVLIVATVVTYFGIELDPETQGVLVDNLVMVGTGVSALVATILSLWSKYREGQKKDE